MMFVCESHLVRSNSLQPHGLYDPWNSPGQNTRVGSLSLLQGIFPSQGLNPGLVHCRWILYQLRLWYRLLFLFQSISWFLFSFFFQSPASRKVSPDCWSLWEKFTHMHCDIGSEQIKISGLLKQLQKLKNRGMCRGPAPAGSRGTLRMNGVGKRRHSETKLGAKSEVYFCTAPLYPLQHLFGGSAYCLHKGQLKHYSNLTFNRNRMSSTYFSITRVFVVIWPSGLLTFYGLLQVCLKQSQ